MKLAKKFNSTSFNLRKEVSGEMKIDLKRFGIYTEMILTLGRSKIHCEVSYSHLAIEAS